MRTIWLATLFTMVATGGLMAQHVETGFLDRTVTVDGLQLRYQVYVPSNYTADTAWPVILFLHGSGERGADGLRPTIVGIGPAIRNDPKRFPAIVVFPQAPADSSWTGVPARAAMAALDEVVRTYRTDPERVYLVGLSMGAHGTWYLAYRHAERFAAVVPICGWVETLPAFVQRGPAVPDAEPFAALARALRDVPVWIFHGERDDVVPASQSRAAAAALRAAGGNVRYTEFLGVNHNSWDPTFASIEFTNWLFAQRRATRSSR